MLVSPNTVTGLVGPQLSSPLDYGVADLLRECSLCFSSFFFWPSRADVGPDEQTRSLLLGS